MIGRSAVFYLILQSIHIRVLDRGLSWDYQMSLLSLPKAKGDNMKKLVVMLALGMASFGAMAVDGYKDAKFGMAEEEFLSKKFCHFEKVDENYLAKEMSVYLCSDFPIANKKREAMAIFLNGKFKRLEIDVSPFTKAASKSVEKKYGQPSSYSSKEEYEDALKNGGVITFAYDNDTVAVNVYLTGDKESSQLVYTSSDFKEKTQGLRESLDAFKSYHEQMSLDRTKLEEDI
ncbi:hypothetical protein A9255_19950 [Xenorhabdus hominickii]|uniref:Uncharacterized protein n=3 Tax=Xenorhabdus hominickii TaxID=351679 RepID=A0A1D7P4U0_XENHO|nr:hypothetical protein A9255_06070 [Xenorhabdus hominickii]AOM42617.1 hypothetical protein A9255_19950 [Xenorhabdus hominickii]PHM54207.1 hypothetical protein Xhom_03282 [Xenorhabdus hominickii]